MTTPVACLLYPDDISAESLAKFKDCVLQEFAHVQWITHSTRWPKERQAYYACLAGEAVE